MTKRRMKKVTINCKIFEDIGITGKKEQETARNGKKRQETTTTTRGLLIGNKGVNR